MAPRTGQQFAAADQVFTGTVLDSTRSGRGPGQIVYDVEVDRSFKGDVAGTVQVATAASSATCGLEGIPLGSDYIFFSTTVAKGRDMVTANLCGGSTPLTEALVRKVEAVAGPGTTPPTESGDGDADAGGGSPGADGDADAETSSSADSADSDDTEGSSADDGIPVWPFIGGVLVIALLAATRAARRTT